VDAVGSDLTGHVAGNTRAVWQRLLSQPGTAIVGAQLLQSRPAGFQLHDAEGGAFQPATVWVRDDRSTQAAVRLRVIGIADARGPFGRTILVGTPTLAGWPAPTSTTYYAAVAPGQDARTVASEMALALPSMRVQAIAEQQRIVDGVHGLLYVILDGFMGIGLVAGVTALGIISLRSVVERRRHIGMVRALGFSARAVGVGLLMESGVVALGGASIGVSLGLLVGQSTVTFLQRQSPQLRFTVPWDQLALIVLLSVGASLLLTLLPALQAARLSPAEALRE
jgi:putative ABC transport system permease protein